MRVTFEQHIRDTKSSKEAKEIIKEIDWYTWLEVPGLPPVTADFNTQEAKDA